MNNHKLNLNQFSENYYLIAIHSDLDEFRLAFFLNDKLSIGLIRKNIDIILHENKSNYSIYEYLDEAMFLKWIFFSNKSLVAEKTSNNELLNLFSQENIVQNEISLINQPKGVDYFLVIENVKNKIYVEKVLKKISEIRGVITAFISDKKLENKENLILS
ncbi:MAG: IPExxxVDY family protein [Flavobacteriaceae bacterium]